MTTLKTLDKSDEKQIIRALSKYCKSLDKKLITRAIDFAKKYHAHQTRASGEPYYYHPIEVGMIVASMNLDSNSIAAAILHDTIEDTKLTLREIEANFNSEVSKMVDGVTKLSLLSQKQNEIKQAENFRKLLIAMSEDIRILLIKLSDRLHNMRTIDFIKQEKKRKRIALETLQIYAPLAERIGMHQIKTELQDISFRVLYPQIRNEINELIKSWELSNADIIESTINNVKKYIASKSKAKIKIFGRKKTPYSSWMKAQNKKVNIADLSDILAFRIITETVEECYTVLMIIHDKYQMIPNKFQDFISLPKNNGYQSIHTVVFGANGQKIEFQIRTQEMHDVAEFGLAAHWQYKQGNESKTEGTEYRWLRELLSILEKNENPEEFYNNSKMSMYYNQVFCFSADGTLAQLPKGATILDFAYDIYPGKANFVLPQR